MMKEVQITLKGLGGQMYKEHGIGFSTCPAQAHWQHGRVERLARAVRESLLREQFAKLKLHVLGWQTIIKSIENTVNDTPIGSITKKDNATAERLEILSPNTFKFARLNRRAPQAPFQLPNVDLCDYTLKVQQVWQAWWHLWQEFYVEDLFERPKWFEDGEPAGLGDLVMFKRKSSEFGKHYSMGVIDEFVPSHDGKLRSVWVRYKLPNETNSRRVERDLKSIYKIMAVGDTSLHTSLERAWKIANQLKKQCDDEGVPFTEAADDLATESPSEPKGNVNSKLEREPLKDSENAGVKEVVKAKSKRKTEVEKLMEWSVNMAVGECNSGVKDRFMDLLLPNEGLEEERGLCQLESEAQ